MLLSIIVPVFNTSRFLRGCLDSILGIESNDLEVIAVEGHGNDDSVLILRDYALHDARVRVFQQRENMGLSEDRNKGLSEATGQFVMFVDSDDTIEPEGLEALMAILREDPSVDLIRVGFKLVWEDRPYSMTVRCLDFGPTRGTTAMNRLVETGCFDPLSQIHIVRRAFLREHSLNFFPGIHYEDNLFSFQALWKAERVVSRQLYIYRYLQRPGSLANQTTLNHLKSSVLVYSELEKLNAVDNTSVRLLAKGLQFQVDFNLKAGFLGISRGESTKFWVWLYRNPLLAGVFKRMVGSPWSRLLLRASPRVYYRLRKLTQRIRTK